MSVAFCRYLLDHNRLDPLNFLDAVDQLRRMTPTLPRLVLDHALLDHETMLKVFAHQAQQKISFEASCKALGFWTENFEKALAKILGESHQSIFHILLERDLISPQDLIAAMDDFLVEHNQPGISEKEVAA
jgi:hypothetical protein